MHPSLEDSGLFTWPSERVYQWVEAFFLLRCPFLARCLDNLCTYVSSGWPGNVMKIGPPETATLMDWVGRKSSLRCLEVSCQYFLPTNPLWSVDIDRDYETRNSATGLFSKSLILEPGSPPRSKFFSSPHVISPLCNYPFRTKPPPWPVTSSSFQLVKEVDPTLACLLAPISNHLLWGDTPF